LLCLSKVWDNIKIRVDAKEVKYEGVTGFIFLRMIKLWWALVNKIMNFGVP
jgi:hypothetical protein